MSDLMLDVGQANELKLAFRRAGYTNEDVKRLCEGPILANVRDVILGHAEIQSISQTIDCDADPFIPKGWTVEEHQRSDPLVWSPEAVKLYLSEHQRRDKAIVGHALRKVLKGQPVMNACVLDWLLAHPHLIPEQWKEKTNGYTTLVFFWGTVYRDSHGDQCVRCLCWDGGQWYWHYSWLGLDWHGYIPAALRAK